MSDGSTRFGFGFGFWAIALASMVLLYPLSFGPACWISQRAGMDGTVVSVVYQPVLQAAMRGPDVVGSRVLSCANWGMQPGHFSTLLQEEGSFYCQWEPITGYGCIF